MSRLCRRCSSVATQSILCRTELIEDKNSVLKKGDWFNAIPSTDICGECSSELFEMLGKFMKEFD